MNGLQLTSGNIGYFASFLHSSVDIQERVIHFPSGTANEQLLEVPLGQVDPHATIVITVGLDHSHPNTPGIDSDFIVGISDSNNYHPACQTVSFLAHREGCYVTPQESRQEHQESSVTLPLSVG